jgi:hypothetical protein
MKLTEIRRQLSTGKPLTRILEENLEWAKADPDKARKMVVQAATPLNYTRQGVDYAFRRVGIRRIATVRRDRGQSRSSRASSASGKALVPGVVMTDGTVA